MDLAEAERTLGMRLAGPVLAVVMWSERHEPVPDHELLSLAATLGHALDAPGVLTVHGAPSLLWGWLALRGRPEPGAAVRLRETVAPPP